MKSLLQFATKNHSFISNIYLPDIQEEEVCAAHFQNCNFGEIEDCKFYNCNFMNCLFGGAVRSTMFFDSVFNSCTFETGFQNLGLENVQWTGGSWRNSTFNDCVIEGNVSLEIFSNCLLNQFNFSGKLEAKTLEKCLWGHTEFGNSSIPLKFLDGGHDIYGHRHVAVIENIGAMPYLKLLNRDSVISISQEKVKKFINTGDDSYGPRFDALIHEFHDMNDGLSTIDDWFMWDEKK